MLNIYHIREGGGIVTESSLPEVARLIDAGRLRFVGKKQKWDKRSAQMAMLRYYVRKNQ